MLNKSSKTRTFMLQMHSLAAACTKPLFSLDRFKLCVFVQTEYKTLLSFPHNCADIMTLANNKCNMLKYLCHIYWKITAVIQNTKISINFYKISYVLYQNNLFKLNYWDKLTNLSLSEVTYNIAPTTHTTCVRHMWLIAQRSQTPELCCWQSHWVNVNMTAGVQQLLSGYLFAYRAEWLNEGRREAP